MLYDVGVFVIAILIRSVMLKRLTLYSLEEVSLLYPFQGVQRGGGGGASPDYGTWKILLLNISQDFLQTR